MPAMCMACGQPSTDYIRKNFAWCPPWVSILILAGLLPYVIVASMMTKRMHVEVPVCAKHRGYWWKRGLLMWLPMLFLILGGIGLAILADEMRQKDLMGFVCLGSVLAVLTWLIVALVIQSLMIRPTEITDRTITLKSVNDGFAASLNEMQDDHEGRRRRRYDDDDYCEDRPRRRPPRAEYDEPPSRRDDRTDIRSERDFEE
jgi:hypothetical protein